MRKFSLVLLMAITLFACQKKTEADKEISNPSLHLISITPAVSHSQLVKGGINFNTFGISHNAYLNYVRGNSDFYGLTDQQRFEYGKSYSGFTLSSDLENETWADFSLKLSTITTIVDTLFTISNMSDYLLADSITTPLVASFYDGLSNVYKNSVVSGEMISPASFSSSVFALLSLVDTNAIILDNTTGKCNDHAAIMMIASIAVYSYDYWYNNYDNWFEDNDFETIGLRDWWYRVRRASADAYGYAIEPWYRDGDTYWWSHSEGLYYAAKASNAVNY